MFAHEPRTVTGKGGNPAAGWARQGGRVEKRAGLVGRSLSPLPFFQFVHRAGHAAVHQQAAVARAGFANGGDADGGLVGHGTFVLADAAADAQRGIHVRPAQRDGIAVALDDGDFARENGLG